MCDPISHAFDVFPRHLVMSFEEFKVKVLRQFSDLKDVETDYLDNIFITVKRFSRKTIHFSADLLAVFNDT